MALYILLAFIGVPLAEIAVFIQVGGVLGLWPTLGAVVLTAVLGTYFLRLQGFETLRRARASLEREEFPVREVFDGLCLLVAGALLLTPGFITDALGALLLVPAFRGALGAMVARRLVSSGRIRMKTMGPGRNGGPGEGRGEEVIDGEFEEVPEEEQEEDESPPRLRQRRGAGRK